MAVLESWPSMRVVDVAEEANPRSRLSTEPIKSVAFGVENKLKPRPVIVSATAVSASEDAALCNAEKKTYCRE